MSRLTEVAELGSERLIANSGPALRAALGDLSSQSM